MVIPAGTTVVLNADTPNLGALTINGTLKFAGQDVKLTASNITINATGALLVGDAAAPFTNKAIITLTGARPSFPANRVIDNTRGIRQQLQRSRSRGVVTRPPGPEEHRLVFRDGPKKIGALQRPCAVLRVSHHRKVVVVA